MLLPLILSQLGCSTRQPDNPITIPDVWVEEATIGPPPPPTSTSVSGTDCDEIRPILATVCQFGNTTGGRPVKVGYYHYQDIRSACPQVLPANFVDEVEIPHDGCVESAELGGVRVRAGRHPYTVIVDSSCEINNETTESNNAKTAYVSARGGDLFIRNFSVIPLIDSLRISAEICVRGTGYIDMSWDFYITADESNFLATNDRAYEWDPVEYTINPMAEGETSMNSCACDQVEQFIPMELALYTAYYAWIRVDPFCHINEMTTCADNVATHRFFYQGVETFPP